MPIQLAFCKLLTLNSKKKVHRPGAGATGSEGGAKGFE